MVEAQIHTLANKKLTFEQSKNNSSVVIISGEEDLLKSMQAPIKERGVKIDVTPSGNLEVYLIPAFTVRNLAGVLNKRCNAGIGDGDVLALERLMQNAGVEL